VGDQLTVRKDPIGSTNHQWRITDPHTNGSFTLSFYIVSEKKR